MMQGLGTPQPMQDQQPVEQEQEGNASPEEQAMYDQFVENAYELIMPEGEGGAPSPVVMRHLGGDFEAEIAQAFQQAQPPLSGEPKDNLAVTSVLLVMMLEGSAAQAGTEVPPDVVYHGGAEIIEALTAAGEKAGVFELSEEDMETAWYRAVDLYRVASPRMTPEAVQELAADFDSVVQADREGRLGEIIPGA